MTGFWSVFILVLVIGNVALCAWLMTWTSKIDPGEGKTTGHRWDGDIVEGNNPLPRWWLGLFWLTIAFSAVYLLAYPGVGTFAGMLGWSQVGQYEEEIARAEENYGAIFAAFAGTPITELATDPAALSAGRNLFANNCAACHGSDGRGARGFPNLTDDEWQWGGAPETIEATILNGRTGAMPAFGAVLDAAAVELLADYVLHLGGEDMDATRAQAAAPQYATYCAVCHGAEGQGGPLFGAPPFANDIWLYGRGRTIVRDVITNGRTNTMPAQGALLGADRVHVLAAYVVSLSQRGAAGGEPRERDERERGEDDQR
jgi:cytochrome c oxidase cbb3-type subunit 3